MNYLAERTVIIRDVEMLVKYDAENIQDEEEQGFESGIHIHYINEVIVGEVDILNLIDSTPIYEEIKEEIYRQIENGYE